MDVKKIKKTSLSGDYKYNEYIITDPPHTVIMTPSFQPRSQGITMRVGGLKEMIKELDDEDSFRIEWFDGYKATEFSFIKDKSD
jgi:hypothetical protein